MASKRGVRRRAANASCRGKRRYATAAEARRVCGRLWHGLGDSQRPYACGLCGGWHTGHTPGGRRLSLLHQISLATGG